jgi:hypothetical protein
LVQIIVGEMGAIGRIELRNAAASLNSTINSWGPFDNTEDLRSISQTTVSSNPFDIPSKTTAKAY